MATFKVSGWCVGSAGLLLACCGMVGCQSQAYGPSGRQTGHVDPYENVKGTERDRAVSEVTLLEFADQVTQTMSERIPQVADIKNSPNKVVIAVGDIANRTKTPSNDFVAIRSQIFSDLVNSSVANVADILETIEVMDQQMARYAPQAGSNRLDERVAPPAGAARYDPRETYILNGDFSEISRGEAGRASTYLFNCRLVNLGTSKVVYSDRITVKQVRP